MSKNDEDRQEFFFVAHCYSSRYSKDKGFESRDGDYVACWSTCIVALFTRSQQTNVDRERDGYVQRLVERRLESHFKSYYQ